ncbi:unnamed protein product [Brachionus calyciflorus]|uniref:Uncharacterized protein n=1 Tax=Brachionus calyciflorus TaxID=104777 RepID=A0A814RSG6_9BILA|nr:unnamed protein product [Brachionus calyciflorus]
MSKVEQVNNTKTSSEPKKNDGSNLSSLDQSLSFGYFSPLITPSFSLYSPYGLWNFYTPIYSPAVTPFAPVWTSPFHYCSFGECSNLNLPKLTITEEKGDTKEEKREDKAATPKFTIFTLQPKEIQYNKEEFDKQVEQIKKDYEKLFVQLNTHLLN